MSDDARQHAPAAERNKQAILDVLKTVLPGVGVILEVASGTGQHAVFFAGGMPHLRWLPSDASADSLASIAGYAADERLPNLLPAILLDAAAAEWPDLSAHGVSTIVCINMIHISPWAACEGLVRNAGRLLKSGQALVFYGPFLQDGVETAPSNVDFDENLRRRDPRWGVRRLEDVTRLAEAAGFRQGKVVAMPANNLTVAFFKD